MGLIKKDSVTFVPQNKVRKKKIKKNNYSEESVLSNYKGLNLEKKNLIKNLSHEIFNILREWIEENKFFFKRVTLFKKIVLKFKNEKKINLKKRMYDVINIFCSLNLLVKNKSLF